MEMLRRYFIANPAPVFQIRRLRLKPGPFIRCRCGNSDGFYWGRWHVTWRIPFSKVWGFNGREWVPAYMLHPVDGGGV